MDSDEDDQINDRFIQDQMDMDPLDDLMEDSTGNIINPVPRQKFNNSRPRP